MRRSRRTYDHRLKAEIIRTGNPGLFPELNIPRSTAKSWIRRGLVDVVTLEVFDMSRAELEEENYSLSKRVDKLEARLELVEGAHDVLGHSLQYQRFKEGSVKASLISMIEKARVYLKLEDCLSALSLSKQRFFYWMRRARDCALDDHSSYPRVTPTQLSHPEVTKLKELVLNPDLGHFSLTSLWLLAQRTGELLISQSTWFRYIRKYELRKFRSRKYEAKAKVGLRASSPNQIWHIDSSVLVFGGVRGYVQVVRDNYSRFILSYRVARNISGLETRVLLEEAVETARSHGYLKNPPPPVLISDSGGENVNREVKALHDSGVIEHFLAQIDIIPSNSMIESLFHQFKNRYLYFKEIKEFEDFEKHTKFYFDQHNEVIPFAALGGSTPFEVYESAEVGNLKSPNRSIETRAAREKRMEYHRSLSCSACG